MKLADIVEDVLEECSFNYQRKGDQFYFRSEEDAFDIGAQLIIEPYETKFTFTSKKYVAEVTQLLSKKRVDYFLQDNNIVVAGKKDYKTTKTISKDKKIPFKKQVHSTLLEIIHSYSPEGIEDLFPQISSLLVREQKDLNQHLREGKLVLEDRGSGMQYVEPEPPKKYSFKTAFRQIAEKIKGTEMQYVEPEPPKKYSFKTAFRQLAEKIKSIPSQSKFKTLCEKAGAHMYHPAKFVAVGAALLFPFVYVTKLASATEGVSEYYIDYDGKGDVENENGGTTTRMQVIDILSIGMRNESKTDELNVYMTLDDFDPIWGYIPDDAYWKVEIGNIGLTLYGYSINVFKEMDKPIKYPDNIYYIGDDTIKFIFDKTKLDRTDIQASTYATTGGIYDPLKSWEDRLHTFFPDSWRLDKTEPEPKEPEPEPETTDQTEYTPVGQIVKDTLDGSDKWYDKKVKIHGYVAIKVGVKELDENTFFSSLLEKLSSEYAPDYATIIRLMNWQYNRNNFYVIVGDLPADKEFSEDGHFPAMILWDLYEDPTREIKLGSVINITGELQKHPVRTSGAWFDPVSWEKGDGWNYTPPSKNFAPLEDVLVGRAGIVGESISTMMQVSEVYMSEGNIFAMHKYVEGQGKSARMYNLKVEIQRGRVPSKGAHILVDGIMQEDKVIKAEKIDVIVGTWQNILDTEYAADFVIFEANSPVNIILKNKYGATMHLNNLDKLYTGENSESEMLGVIKPESGMKTIIKSDGSGEGEFDFAVTRYSGGLTLERIIITDKKISPGEEYELVGDIKSLDKGLTLQRIRGEEPQTKDAPPPSSAGQDSTEQPSPSHTSSSIGEGIAALVAASAGAVASIFILKHRRKEKKKQELHSETTTQPPIQSLNSRVGYTHTVKYPETARPQAGQLIQIDTQQTAPQQPRYDPSPKGNQYNNYPETQGYSGSIFSKNQQQATLACPRCAALKDNQFSICQWCGN